MLSKIQNNFQNSLHLGVKMSDPEPLVIQKVSITLLTFIVAPASLIWGLLYFSFGNFLSASIPLLYFVISLFSLWHLKITKNIFLIQRVQMLMTLIFPFLLMWSLGGFAQGSMVMLWAFFAPVIASIIDKTKRSFCWFYSFIGLVVFSSIIDPILITSVPNTLPELAVEILFYSIS